MKLHMQAGSIYAKDLQPCSKLTDPLWEAWMWSTYNLFLSQNQEVSELHR